MKVVDEHHAVTILQKTIEEKELVHYEQIGQDITRLLRALTRFEEFG